MERQRFCHLHRELYCNRSCKHLRDLGTFEVNMSIFHSDDNHFSHGLFVYRVGKEKASVRSSDLEDDPPESVDC